MNSRPLTKLSGDINDMATLMPNHLLLKKEGPLPAMYHRSDMYRKRKSSYSIWLINSGEGGSENIYHSCKEYINGLIGK